MFPQIFRYILSIIESAFVKFRIVKCVAIANIFSLHKDCQFQSKSRNIRKSRKADNCWKFYSDFENKIEYICMYFETFRHLIQSNTRTMSTFLMFSTIETFFMINVRVWQVEKSINMAGEQMNRRKEIWKRQHILCIETFPHLWQLFVLWHALNLAWMLSD